jgi:hypothetical protein
MDLKILPISKRAGKERPQITGLHVAQKPRRPARGRRPDALVLYLDIQGNAPIAPEGVDKLLKHLAQTYYKTSGTVTTAMRKAAVALNQYLLDRNLRNTSSGQQSVGVLTMATMRNDHLYLGHCGPAHSFLISAEGVRYFYDDQSANRGLGLGRATPLRYFQTELKMGDTLLLTTQPPATWRPETLSGLHKGDVHKIRHHLLGASGPDLETVLLQTAPGEGTLHLLSPRSAPPPQQPAHRTAEKPTSPEPAAAQGRKPIITPAPESPAPAPTEKAQAVEERTREARASRAVQPVSDTGAASAGGRQVATPAKKTTQSSQVVPQKPRQGINLQPLIRALGAVSAALGAALGWASRVLGTLFRRMIPLDAISSLPSSVMAFTAIAVPLVVVAVATVVYFQRGVSGQYQTYYNQAAETALQAQELEDPQARRSAWTSVLLYLDQAEKYNTTQDSQALRAEARRVFDQLDSVTRLAFQPAIAGDLPASFRIEAIDAAQGEIFLLDGDSGNISRAFSTARGYELDTTFQCGNDFPGGQMASALIDLVSVPADSSLDASVLGIDASGNILQCSPGEPPLYTPLTPPVTGWGVIKGFTLHLGHLYVLDPDNNAVWIYWNNDFSQAPQLFFAQEVPPMEDVIDLTVEKDDLYLLHEDGHLTLCTFSALGVSPTHCTDPAPYVDSRPGRENLPLIPEAPFTSVHATQPPDPSLFLLEPQSRAIYHFSLRQLTFQRQFRPQDPQYSGQASAFTLTPDGRIAFLALGNELLYAGMP